MTGSGDRPLKDILSSVLQDLTEEKKGQKAAFAWEDAAGPEMRGHTRPLSFRGGRLVVAVSDSARLYELTLRKKELIEAMNARLEKKAVKDIRFKIGTA